MDSASRIKLIRGDISQSGFALRVGVSAITVGRWERGERLPGQEHLCKILEIYPDINPAWLLTGEGPMKRGAPHVAADGTTCDHPYHEIISAPPTEDLDLDLLLRVHDALHAALQSRRTKLDSDKKAQVSLLIYRNAFWNKKTIRPEIIDHILDFIEKEPTRDLVEDGDERKVWGYHTDDVQLDEGEYALVPRYNVEVSAGHGCWPEEEEVIEKMAFRRSWLQRLGLQVKSLVLVTARGDSMEPTFYDGDLLLVDLGQVKVIDGGISVIRNDGLLLAKRLQAGLGEQVYVCSDNPRYQRLETIKKNLNIVGRVVWRGGKM